MPARIALTDEQIKTALAATGGHISAAACLLNVCTRTLRRRLAANPALRPAPAADPVWVRALEGDAAIRAGTNPYMRGTDAWTRYINLLDWEETEIEDEPQVLGEADTVRLLSYIGPETRLVTPQPRDNGTRRR